MESIRNFLKSWPGRIFLIICLSPLVLLGINGGGSSGRSDPNVIATVAEQDITKEQFRNKLNARRNDLLTNADVSAINEEVLQDQVLNELIDEALLQQQTKNLGMYISDKRINDMLLEESVFQDESGQFSNERFSFYLQQRRINKLQLFDEVRNNASSSQLNNTILKTAVYPTKSINDIIDIQEESRHVWVHRLPWQEYVDEVTLNDNQIEAYYNEHRGDLNSKAKVDLSYMLLSPEAIEIPEVTEDDILLQYEDYKRRNMAVESRRVSQILLTGDNANAKAEEVVQKLDAGTSFEELVISYSEDEGSRNSGGDIGTFNPSIFGDDAAAVEQALAGLSVGDVTAPVKTAYGYQIFKVTSDSGVSMPSIDEVREELEQKAAQYKRETVLADKITLINEMAVEGVGLEDIAKQEGLVVKTIEDYVKVDNKSILNQPAIVNAAFDELNIQDEAVSTNIDVDDLMVWVQPHNYRPIAPLSLEAATSQIKDILVEQHAKQLAVEHAQRLADEVASSSMDEVDVTFKDLGLVTRQSQSLTDKESSLVFSQEIDSSERVTQAYEIEDGATVLVMDPMSKQSNQSLPESIRIQTAMLIRGNKGQEQLEDYFNYLRSTSEVVLNDTIIEEVGDI